jgi:hypothetical protein
MMMAPKQKTMTEVLEVEVEAWAIWMVAAADAPWEEAVVAAAFPWAVVVRVYWTLWEEEGEGVPCLQKKSP